MLARAQKIARSLDTRTKIELGGLVILAELGEEEPAVLLGLLKAGAAILAGPDSEMARAGYRRAGDRAFKVAEENRLAARLKAKTLPG